MCVCFHQPPIYQLTWPLCPLRDHQDFSLWCHLQVTKETKLFPVSHTKADQPHDVVREHEHTMWDELVNGGVILGLHFSILVLWP